MAKKNNFSTLIFDLGGVLVDLDRERCCQNFEKLGVYEISNILSTTMQTGFIFDFEIGKIDTQTFRDEIRKQTTNSITDEQIDQAWNSFLVSIPTAKLDLLHELRKQYRIVMLSNTNPLSFAYCRDNMFTQQGKKIEDYFDKCYLSYQMKKSKPEKDIFLQLLAEENKQPEECLFLDDSQHNIATAKALGIATQWIPPHTTLRPTDFLS